MLPKQNWYALFETSSDAASPAVPTLQDTAFVQIKHLYITKEFNLHDI